VAVKTSKTKAGLCVGVMASVLFGATLSFAETQWEKDHPGRDEVNDRLENQSSRIENGREDGTLTGNEAQKLHREDRAIRRQERRYARHHGGHISKAEQAKLNREEDRVSSQIHNDEHDGN
jgi:hypothetical protein